MCTYSKGNLPASSWQLKAANVLDGDTIGAVSDQSGSYRYENLRLWGIDAPESEQDHSDESTRYLENLMDSYFPIRVCVYEQTSYGRPVVELFGWSSGRWDLLNCRMVRGGFAYVDPEFVDDDHHMVKMQNEAKQHNRRLHKFPDLIMPWDWRDGVRS